MTKKTCCAILSELSHREGASECTLKIEQCKKKAYAK
nr:MAG TPA: hypothetical protein [Caudoviricetes sp.]